MDVFLQYGSFSSLCNRNLSVEKMSLTRIYITGGTQAAVPLCTKRSQAFEEPLACVLGDKRNVISISFQAMLDGLSHITKYSTFHVIFHYSLYKSCIIQYSSFHFATTLFFESPLAHMVSRSNFSNHPSAKRHEDPTSTEPYQEATKLAS